MPQILPFTNDPAQSFTVAIGGAKYLFDARYNDIGGFWTFDITAEPSQVQLVAGVPILIGQDMLAPYGLGLGGLFATDTVSGGVDAGPDDLGDRVTVTWLSMDELALIPPPEPLPFVPPAVVVPPTPPFTPLALGATLKLWLRGDLGITQSLGNVTTWADQSGNGNNVTGSIPYNSSSIGGLPGLTFSSAGMTNGASNVITGASARTIIVVSKPSSATPGSVLTLRTTTLKADYFLGTPGFPLMIYTDGVNPLNNASIPGHSISGVPTISEWSSAGPGALLGYKENGAALVVTQTSGSSTDNGTTGFSIGGSGAAIQNFAGDIDEVIVCDSVLSAADELLVKTYLSTRYGIAVS